MALPSLVINRKMSTVRIAAGSTMRKFSRNLSFISQPCVFTAAMVVSEIMDRLSPNIAPQTTAPMQIAMAKPVFSLMPTAMGARAAMVPMEVPMDTEIKHPMTKSPATATPGGRTESPRFTVLSTPPAAVTAPEKPPAQRKIRLMVMMLSSPTPFAMIWIFSSKLTFLFCRNATHRAMRNATMVGME